jgi:hypothetical protein
MIVFTEKHELRKQINTLTLKNEELEDIIKEGLYKTFMENEDNKVTIARLREDNKRLRAQLKELKKGGSK